jgi:hypothetical protein
MINEDLRKWFGKGKEGGVGGGGWDRYNSSGDRVGKCGDAKEGDAYSACLSKEKAKKLGKAGRAAFVKRKRAAQSKGGDAKKGGEQNKGQKPIKVKTGVSENTGKSSPYGSGYQAIREYTPSNPANIDKAIREIEKLGIRNPVNPKEIIIDDSVFIEISNWDKRLWFSSLHSMDRGHGNASRVMQKIVDIADKYNVTIALDAVPYGTGTGRLSRSQLVKFYKKFGFKFEDGQEDFGDMERISERINLFLEKNIPTNPTKWSYYKSQAKKKFDVYPSAYANAWAAKKYKAAGGGWRKSSKNETVMLKLETNLLKVSKPYEFYIGDRVRNINPTCAHYKSTGDVVYVHDDGDITYKVDNNGATYTPGDELTKSADQLIKVFQRQNISAE